MDDLQQFFEETIENLNDLLLVTVDEDQREAIRSYRRMLNTILDEKLAEIDKGSDSFRNAIAELEKASKSAVSAKKDVAQVGSAIGKMEKAVKLLEKLIAV